jgi:hypothetical protein
MLHDEQIWAWWLFFVYLWLWLNLCIWFWIFSGWIIELWNNWCHPERERRKRRQRQLQGLDTQLRLQFKRAKPVPRAFPTTPATQELNRDSKEDA